MNDESRSMNHEGKIKNFTDLNTWREGHKLALAIYRTTGKFPISERFSLADQMRRASVSVTSNVAEGFSRNSTKDKVHFYNLAQGSITELQNQLILSRDLKYLPRQTFEELLQQTTTVQKLLSGLVKATRNLNP